MKRVLIAALAAVLTVSAFTGAAVLTGRFKNSVVPVAHAIPMSTTISRPSASAKLESAQGPALTSGAALCAALPWWVHTTVVPAATLTSTGRYSLSTIDT